MVSSIVSILGILFLLQLAYSYWHTLVVLLASPNRGSRLETTPNANGLGRIEQISMLFRSCLDLAPTLALPCLVVN